MSRVIIGSNLWFGDSSRFLIFQNLLNSDLKQFSSMTNKTIFRPFILVCLASWRKVISGHPIFNELSWEALLLSSSSITFQRSMATLFQSYHPSFLEFTFSWRIFARFYYYKHGLGPTLVRHNSQLSTELSRF